MEITLRPSRPDEIPLLARMNHALIRDEGSRNPMTLAQLEQRMRGWIENGATALIIEAENEIAGYLLYRERKDEYFPDRTEIYLRQMYIVPELRGRSIGSDAVNLFVEEHLPSGARVLLEVLETNPRARRFWERAGFTPYSVAMQRTIKNG